MRVGKTGEPSPSLQVDESHASRLGDREPLPVGRDRGIVRLAVALQPALVEATGGWVDLEVGDIELTLNGAGEPRTYSSLSTLEHDAFMSRIWGGIHFRDAMDDAYLTGHTVAGHVCG